MSDLYKLFLPKLRVLYAGIIIYFIFKEYIISYVFNGVNREIFVKGFIFFYPAYTTVVLSAAVIFVFYHIGKQVKRVFGFQHVTTGVVGFFGLTFLYNLVLGLCRISSPAIETTGVFAFAGFLFLMNIKDIEETWKKISFVFLICFAFFVIAKLSEFITINRFPFSLEPFADEIHNWYPRSVRYFDDGLLAAMKGHAYAGYGLFVHHVWVTTKRLFLLNLPALYYLPPKLLLLLGFGFLLELKLPRSIILFAIVIYIFSMIDAWLRFLMVSGLYGEGVTAVFFAILLKEILDRTDYVTQSNINSNTSKTAVFWMITGVLSLTKPLISYICFLLPFINIPFFLGKNLLRSLKKVGYNILFMGVPLGLWVLASKFNGLKSSHYELTLPSVIEPHVFFQILKHWSLHMMTIKLYILSFLGALIGMAPYNRFKITCLLFFVCLNAFLIYGLYATLWVDVEKESAFRYFSKTYYLLLYAFILGCERIFTDSYIYFHNVWMRIRLRYFDNIIKKPILPILGMAVLLVATGIAAISYHNSKEIIYTGFYDREKWPNKNYYLRWSKKESVIRLKKGGMVEIHFICNHPEVEVIPVKLSISMNGSEIDRITFTKKGLITKHYHLTETSKRPIELTLNTSRTWNPHARGISADARDLGIAVSEVKYLDNISK